MGSLNNGEHIVQNPVRVFKTDTSVDVSDYVGNSGILRIKEINSPDDISDMHIWLDGQDEDTVTLVSGNVVTAWQSKAYRNLTTTRPGNKDANSNPLYVTSSGLNGHNALRFLNIRRGLGNQSIDLPASFPLTVFVVASHSHTTTPWNNNYPFGIFFNSHLFYQDSYIGLSHTRSQDDNGYDPFSAGFTVDILWGDILSERYFYGFKTVRDSNEIGSVVIYETVFRNYNDFDFNINGTPAQNTYDSTIEYGIPEAPSGIWQGAVIGCSNTNFGFIGEIGEILVYSKALDTFERQSIRQYLNRKWA